MKEKIDSILDFFVLLFAILAAVIAAAGFILDIRTTMVANDIARLNAENASLDAQLESAKEMEVAHESNSR